MKDEKICDNKITKMAPSVLYSKTIGKAKVIVKNDDSVCICAMIFGFSTALSAEFMTTSTEVKTGIDPVKNINLVVLMYFSSYIKFINVFPI